MIRSLSCAAVLAATLLTGCYQGPGHTRAAGALLGTVAGAAIGGAAGGGCGAATGALLGLATGTIAGEGIAQDQERYCPPPPCFMQGRCCGPSPYYGPPPCYGPGPCQGPGPYYGAPSYGAQPSYAPAPSEEHHAAPSAGTEDGPPPGATVFDSPPPAPPAGYIVVYSPTRHQYWYRSSGYGR